MKHIFTVLRLENIKEHLSRTLHRFPVSSILIALVALLLMSLIHSEFTNELENNIGKAIFTGIVTFFLSVGTYISCESKGVSKKHLHLFQIVPLAFGGLFFMTFSPNIDSFENAIRFIVSLFGIIGFLFFAPYIYEVSHNTGNQDVYYSYFYKVSVVFLWAAILGGSLFILGMIAISSVFTLFDIAWSHSEKLYGDWATFALSVVAPLFALSKLPHKTDFRTSNFDENAFFSFLIKFVAAPFILIYFLILYAYTLKVLLNFGDWPKGEVCWMVIGFSIFGYITYIFSYIFDTKERLIHLLRKYFPFAVIPQVGMLFYAIYLRIAQYDITINRYFVVVFGVWLLFISLYLIISKKKYLAYICALITVFTILISIGPWSVYQLPASRQLARLEDNLGAANMLQDGKIIPLKNIKDIDAKLSGEIYAGIQYLCDLSNCESVKILFPDEYASFLKKHRQDFETQKQKDIEYYKEPQDKKYAQEREYVEPSSWEIVSAITSAIKVQQYYVGVDNPKSMYSFYIDYSTGFFPLDVAGYTQLLRLGNKGEKQSGLYGEVDAAGEKFVIKNGEEILDEFDFMSVQNTLREKFGTVENLPLSKEDMTFSMKGKKYEIQLLLENISFKNPEYTGTDTYYPSINGYILIR